MTKVLIVLLIALVIEAVGVVFLSKGLKEIGKPAQVSVAGIGRVLKRGATNRSLLLGVALEAVFFGALLYLLSQRDVSLIWPLTSLGFVITAFAARFILDEKVTSLRWAGVLLIVLGAGMITWSEKQKERERPANPPAAAAAERAP